MQHLTSLVGGSLWMIQWAAACTGGLWSLYLVVERMMQMAGVV